MEEVGYSFLAEVMLWLMYIALGLAVAAAVVSGVRSFLMRD